MAFENVDGDILNVIFFSSVILKFTQNEFQINGLLLIYCVKIFQLKFFKKNCLLTFEPEI